MSEQMKTRTGVLKRWWQALSHFIMFCLYGKQSPLERAEARRERADFMQHIDAEKEDLRMRARKDYR